MPSAPFGGTLELRAGDRVELLVADGSLARAFFEGIPAARLLGRARLASDERDVSLAARPAATASTWDMLLKRLLGTSRESFDRVKRAIARHTRVAMDEGPLHTSDGTAAALVYAVACSQDPDASLAEICASASTSDPTVALACGVYDLRLVNPHTDKRAPLFEACVRLAAHACVGPLPWERLREAAEMLNASELALAMLSPSKGSLFPPSLGDAAHGSDRRMARLERAELDALVAKDPRELAQKIARVDRDSAPGPGLDTLIADLTHLLEHTGALVLAIPPTEPPMDEEVATPRISKPSWLPADYSTPQAAEQLSDALERGALTVPRLRALMASGGEPALDAIGAEMLHVTAHPFASAAFAEVLARSGRPRDIIRLVTYFAIAPDPAAAARALSACSAPELPRVLSAWLEAMLPSDGEQALLGDDDPETSSAARLTACVASLAPYPQLYRAVRPLLSRVSEAPPPASG